jgi:predicted Zn-dependent protease
MTANLTGNLTRRALLHWLASAGVTLALADRLRADEPHITVPAYNTLSDDEEIALGRDFAKDYESKVQIVQHSLIDAYLGGIVKDLAKASQRPNLPYTIKLVNTHVVNACSIPGGFIYLNRGLVEVIDTEGQLVATIGHELGHIVARHVVNQLILTFQAKRVYDQLRANLLKSDSEVARIIDQLGGAVSLLALLHFDRQNELEADMLGFYEMLRAGYDPSAFLKLFDKFEALESQQASAPPPFLMDHPPTPDRADRIRHELTQVKVPANAREDTLSFHAFRTAMGLLSKPPGEN